MTYDRAQRPESGVTSGETHPPDSGSGAGTYFLGRYRVVDEIGIGGMASVHLGRMDGPGGFQKWVAIKRIHPHLIEDDSFVQMFLDEARVAARISHPNVATVFELGKHDDSYWIAMEYLHGEPLRELMRRTEEIGLTVPPEIACRIIADAAEGLHAAHELTGKNGEQLNLVHRDVTPHNLFVTYDGTTKVVDFGIAKFSSRMSSTRAGTLKGKLAYMSPEQVAGEQIDRRTDVFALGVTLWELTTGQRLFRMESDIDTLTKVQECIVPRPSTIVRGYPIDLEKIVLKALSKNRGERFKTAREFSRALQGLLMRRGLFIASDEVAQYVQSIFQERIQKRDAHLRWAAEVTQTINIDRPQIGLVGGRESIADAREVRPAAGARPQLQSQSQSQPVNPNEANASRHSPTVRPPSLAAAPATESGPYPTNDDIEEFDDNDATIVTLAPRDSAPPGGPTPAAGRSLGESGETHAMPQPQQQNPRGQASPFAGVDARGMRGPQASSPEFHPMPPPQGYGMNMMGPSAPQIALGETLPMNPFNPMHNPMPNPMQSPMMGRGGSSPNLAGYAQNAQMGPPRILLAPAEYGAMDNRTMTAQAVRRATPIWMIAAGSAFGALVLVIAIYLVVSHVGTSAGKGAASASASAPANTTPIAATAIPASSVGPFGGARAAFAHAIEPAPVPTIPAPTATAPAPTPTTIATSAPTATAAAPTPAPTVAAPHPLPQRAPTPVDATGMLTVVCNPACTQVIDNGKILGPSPIFRLKVSVGEHHLQLKNGKLTKVSNTIVTAGDLRSVVVPMTP